MPTWITSLLGSTDPARRRLKVATIVGFIGGAFSALVKFGWEVPFPPRTPGLRSETNPPQSMLEWFGMPHDTSHMMVTFSNNQLPIMSFIVHFSFAIAFGLIYCIAAEYFPRIKMWQGAVFGIVVYIGAHVVVIGHFPHVDRIAEYARLTVLERNCRSELDTPDPACEYVLPEADFAFMTGVTFENKTAPRLLELARNAYVTLVGPSVVMSPMLFEHGVNMLAGSVVGDVERVRRAVKSGGTMRFGSALLMTRLCRE